MTPEQAMVFVRPDSPASRAGVALEPASKRLPLQRVRVVGPPDVVERAVLPRHVGDETPVGELRRLVSASQSVFEALASQDTNISEAVARLPGTLRQTESTLARVDTLAKVLGPSVTALRRPFRTLDQTNAAVRPFLRETTPIVRDQIRPFAREAA